MRITLIAHSAVHMRQWIFAREVSNQGHQVLVVCPMRWGQYGVQSMDKPGFAVRALPTRNQGDIYHFELEGMQHVVESFRPDWIYLQQEAQSDIAEEVASWDDLGARRALFVWENIQQPGPREQAILRKYDLVVAGNLEAYELARPWCTRSPLILPQVGVCPDLFKPRLDVLKVTDVGYVGRPVPEKGLGYLEEAWPTARIVSDANYDELTLVYNQASLIVCYSHDMPPTWKEQSMPYVAAEAIMCGTPVVCSDTASSVFWLHGCPAVKFVHQHNPNELRSTIVSMLHNPPPSGRQWAIERLSNQVVAHKLVDTMNALGCESANA